ncbi:MAG: hypothetical protein JW811_07630 [Clostridiales bacterium]|nr:hypothetical protein [Clostridiales bacterium]
MNENSEVNSWEEPYREITLRQLAFYVLKRWRLLLLAALLCAVGALLISSVFLALEMTDEEYEDVVEKEYNDSVADYTDRIQTLERKIVDLEDDLVWQQAYNQDSTLMKVDPYHKKVSTMTYYVDADEPVVPDYLEQYVSRNDSLLKTYMLYLSGGDLYSQLLERFPDIKDVNCLREIFSVVMYETTGMITITVIGNDDETAQTIFGIVRTGMAEIYKEASKTIGEHELTEIDSNTYMCQDRFLADKQQQSLETIFTLNTQLRVTKIELDDLNEEFKELVHVPLWRRIVMQFLRTAVYTAFGGLIAMALLLAIYYALSDRILDADKLRYAAKLDILGAIPRGKHKRKRRLLDRAAAAVGGVTLKTAEREDALALTARSIFAFVSAKGITEGNIALAGSIAAAELMEIADVFNDAVADAKLKFSAAGNPMRNASAVDGITASGIAVIVEKQEQSSCTDVVKAVDRITAWGKPVLGAVLLDADAM